MGDLVRNGLLLLVFIIFLSVGFSRYVDYPLVYVINQNREPIPGVNVTVTYQSNENRYVTSFPVVTDSSGKAELRVTALANNPDLTYKVTIDYFDYTDTNTITYNPNIKSSTYFTVPINRLRVYISSPETGPINATTDIMGIKQETNVGHVFYYLPPGEYVMRVTYSGEDFEFPFEMGSEHQSLEFSVYEYTPIIEFVDDTGYHLNGTLTVCEKTFAVTSPQNITIICPNQQFASAEVLAKKVTQSINLEDLKIRFVFDLTKPVVRDVKFYADRTSWGVDLDANDPGVYPSGLPNSLRMTYTIQRPSDVNVIQKDVQLTLKQGTQYIYSGIFEHEHPGTRIDATIEVVDIAGNRERLSRTFIVGQDAAIPIGGGQDTNITTDPNGEDIEPDSSELDLVLLGITLVAVIIVVGIIFYLKNKYME
ncbi:hypothetical protein KO465_00085 [Candidatus Micrarchaeota archaeon]|nr:hypothetical protein [Candidatus Micrarchaeota archaeon]